MYLLLVLKYFNSNGWLSLHHITPFLALRMHPEESIILRRFLVVMAWYNPLWAVRLSQKYITSYVCPWERVCSNSEAMGGYCSPPPPHLPVWESTPKSWISFRGGEGGWQEKLMDIAQDDTKETGRCLHKHVYSCLGIWVRFWNTSMAMDCSHCTISHHFSPW